MKINRIVLLTIILLLGAFWLVWAAPAAASSWDVIFNDDPDIEETWDEWLEAGEYFTMVDEDGQVLMTTGRRIYQGDEYLTSNNILYEVAEVDDESNTAYAKKVKEVELPDDRFSIRQLRQQASSANGEAVPVQAPQREEGRIAVYHTHNAESYVPSDGTDSIDGRGGIHDIGSTFQQTLENLGVNVVYSENLHLPHDRGAYRRSRDTALELLGQEPDAMFDIHRDAAPRNAYAAQIGEDWITQVQFVVGRQNQNLGVNRQYAQSLKRAADQLYPGLVKGIFFGRGNYNQDLTPLNLLLEVGAHTNSKDAAERGISLFAEVVDFYFYGPRAEAAERGGLPDGASRVGSRTTWIILALLAAGGLAFYVVNAGGWSAALDRLRRRGNK